MDKISQDYMVVTPAYGRDYKNKADAEKDFRDGKDFVLMSYSRSGYVSKDDFVKGTKVNIRYAKNTKVTTVTA